MAMEIAEIFPETAIPTGPWSFYYHDTQEKKWSLDTFKLIATVKTWSDFWSLFRDTEMTEKRILNGMFFLVQSNIPPLWENHNNIRGGSYSLRIGQFDAYLLFLKYSIAAMLGVAVKHDEDKIVCVEMSPKRGFNVLKLWNKDAGKFKNPKDLVLLEDTIKETDAIFTPHLEKKM